MESTRPFKVGVTIHPQQCTLQELRDAWRRADELGVDSIWFWDHFFPLYGNPNGNHFECWSLLAAAAVDTRAPQIGPMVTCIGYRNPDLLASIAATVDQLSGGRVVRPPGTRRARDRTHRQRGQPERGRDRGVAQGRAAALRVPDCPPLQHQGPGAGAQDQRLLRISLEPLSRPPGLRQRLRGLFVGEPLTISGPRA